MPTTDFGYLLQRRAGRVHARLLVVAPNAMLEPSGEYARIRLRQT